MQTYASTWYDARESGVISSMTAVTHTRPASRTILSAFLASSRRHCPVLLQTMIRNLRADDALCIAPNLRRIILSRCASMLLSSPVTGFRTNTGLSVPRDAAIGWKSPSPR